MANRRDIRDHNAPSPDTSDGWDPDDWDWSGFGKVGPSRADGADPHDDQGHPVDFAGQDCPSCRTDLNRGL
jgi:hypothetical protein